MTAPTQPTRRPAASDRNDSATQSGAGMKRRSGCANRRLWKERAKYSDGLAPRANAMESRWRRFVELGPPPAPVIDQAITVRIRGA